MIRCVDWFSGIGGFSLGLEMAGGFETVAFSEVDPYCCRVLEKRWPGVVNVGDAAHCRDTLPAILGSDTREGSSQGSLAGPVLLLENVRGWRTSTNGLRKVLRDLASIGFDAEWFTICSCLVGAPHHRERAFALAYPNGQGEPFSTIHAEVASLCQVSGSLPWPDPPSDVGMADGIPDRVERLRALGNSVVPQVVAWIGNRIKDSIGDTP